MGSKGGILRSIWRRVDNWLSAGINPEPVALYQFTSAADVAKWRVFTDASFGGRSQAKLELAPDGRSAVFSGTYSKDLGDSGTLIRSGYCGMIQVRTRNVNLCMHDFLDFRIRGDGNTYVASVRVDQLTGGDEEAWQAPLPTRRLLQADPGPSPDLDLGLAAPMAAPAASASSSAGKDSRSTSSSSTSASSTSTSNGGGGSGSPFHSAGANEAKQGQKEWENVRVFFDDFIFTFRGRLVKQPGMVSSMPSEKIMSVGITLSASDDMPDSGNFRLEVGSITAGAFEANGVEAVRKAFRGDVSIRPDPMYDRQRPSASFLPGQPSGGQPQGAAGAEPTLGGRRHRAA